MGIGKYEPGSMCARVCVCGGGGWASRGGLVRFSPLEIPRVLLYVFSLCVYLAGGPFLLWGFVIDTKRAAGLVGECR